MMTFFNPALNGEPGLPWRRAAARLLDWFSALLTGSQTDPGEPKADRAPAIEFSGAQPPDDLKGLRRLEPEAITQIHNRYFPDVFRFARYRLGDPALAEDVAGETFTRLLESSSRGRGPDKNVRGWLLRTASNLVHDYYRAHYSKPTDELVETIASDEPGPAHHAEDAEEKHALREALKQLTEDQLNVLALRFGSGLSLAETASVLGKKPNAIKALQFRAIGALRKSLSDGADMISA